MQININNQTQKRKPKITIELNVCSNKSQQITLNICVTTMQNKAAKQTFNSNVGQVINITNQ